MQPLLEIYNLAWPQQFAQLKCVLSEALFREDVTILHVGSTAVPGLWAKPVIDIDIVYSDPLHFASIKTALQSIGYGHGGDQGINGREVFKRNTTSHPVLELIRHHLYVNAKESAEWQRHVHFRDYLIGNPEARIAYQQLKMNIAQQAKQDPKRYAYLKELQAKPFVAAILEKAKAFASPNQ